jgi:Ca2+-binding EF-hand superfamily protein
MYTLSLISAIVAIANAATSSEEQEHTNDFIAFDLNQDGFVDASEVRT